MVDKQSLKRQHEGIYEIISELKKSTERADGLEENAFAISQKINTLAGKLKVHLGTEDKHMYPYLLDSGKDDLKKIAKDYVTEMGNISDKFTSYKVRFNTSTKITSDIKGFLDETKRILKILEDRMKKEDENLYPLL